ncbi:MAG: hypothetical protein JO225_01265, partial [Candidatus Eremiobacteraeota bacterium]|nr:hypothetical protein [Candidatus Eremiobacteraeota bacterium]
MHVRAGGYAHAPPRARVRRGVTLHPPDALLLGSVALLLTLGLVMVFSASSATAWAQYHDTAYFVKRQFVYLVA